MRILREVGDWMQTGGADHLCRGSLPVAARNYANFTRRGNTLYMHVHFWPGSDVAISGLKLKVLSAKVLKTGQSATVTQDGFRTHITGLPATAPDTPVTTIAARMRWRAEQDTIMCASTSRAQASVSRKKRPRLRNRGLLNSDREKLSRLSE